MKEVVSVAQRTIRNGEISEWNNPYVAIEQCEIGDSSDINGTRKRWRLLQSLPSGLNYADCLEARAKKALEGRVIGSRWVVTDDCDQKKPEIDSQLRDSNPRQVDNSLCEIAAPYINNHWWQSKGLWRLKRPSDGHTEVYLHDSVVIKKPDESDLKWFEFSASRVKEKKLTFVRNICEKNGYELEIPTSCIHNSEGKPEYFVEKRYPISTRKAAALAYDQNPTAFTKSVKDFTGLLMQVHIGDLIAWRPIQPRYDNIVPYLEYSNTGPIGKIALLDLDGLEVNENCKDPVMACIIAITFFPHHYNEIMDVAKQFFPNIEHYRVTLERYESFLAEQGISSTNNYITLEAYKDDTLRDRKRNDIFP